MLIGVLILSQTSAGTYAVDEETDQKEQSEPSSAPADHSTISEAVPSPSSQVNLGFQYILLEEVLLEESQEEHSVIDRVVAGTQNALQVIFRRIISPNAP